MVHIFQDKLDSLTHKEPGNDEKVESSCITCDQDTDGEEHAI